MPTQEHSADSSGNFHDSYHFKSSVTSATAARNSTTSTNDIQSSTSGFIPNIACFSGHQHYDSWGGNDYDVVYRTFQRYTLGPMPDWGGETINSVSLRIHQLADISSFFQNYSSEGSFYVVRATGAESFKNSGAWNDLTGWVSSGTYSGEVEVWSDEVTCASDTTHNIELNSTAVSYFQTHSNNFLSGPAAVSAYIALIHDSDYTDSGYPDDTAQIGTFEGLYSANMAHTTTSYRPLLTVTYGEAISDISKKNSLFFGTNF